MSQRAIPRQERRDAAASVRDLLLPEGYIHRHDLVEAGWRPDRLRATVRREGLVVVRRQWILRPDAASAVRLAAVSGGRVTCVSAGKMLGLWVPRDIDRPHVALPPRSGSVCEQAHVHRSAGVLAAPARSLIDPIENVLARTATCLAFEDALAVWESAIRKGVTTRRHLNSIAWRGERARRLAAAASALSDSGLETLFVRRLHRVGVVMRQQVKLLDHNVDGLIGARLVIQTDGFAHHSDAAQRRSDISHDRALRLLGYTVLRYDYFDIVDEWPRVEAEILAAIAQGLHRAAPGRRAAGR